MIWLMPVASGRASWEGKTLMTLFSALTLLIIVILDEVGMNVVAVCMLVVKWTL